MDPQDPLAAPTPELLIPLARAFMRHPLLTTATLLATSQTARDIAADVIDTILGNDPPPTTTRRHRHRRR